MDLRWGQPSRRVCWLVRPTSFDCYLPEDHTLEWVFCTPYSASQGRRPPEPFFRTIDREEPERFSIELYRRGETHVMITYWRNPDGDVVKKMPIVKRWKEHHLTGFDLFEEHL